MNTKRSNRTITYLILVISLIGALVIANVLFTMVTGIHLHSGRNIKTAWGGSETSVNVVTASRGVIYDRSGKEVIAQDVETYKIVAIIDKRRKDGDKPAYVKDQKKTAKELAPILGMDEDEILNKLKTGVKNGSYQVEFGTKGKNLSIEQKEQVEALELPGIEFEKSAKRYYPNGKFASSLIGFASYDEKKKQLVGRMGLERFLNKELTGTDGKVKYRKDAAGNKLAGSEYVEKNAVNGANVTLTIDKNVQLALENALQKTMSEFDSANAWSIIMEVETGKILAYSGYPSFDLNELDIKDYRDLPSQYAYEPGSVMKAFTYAAAIDSGVYPAEDATFRSGTFNWGYSDEEGIYRSPTPVTGFSPIKDALDKDHGMVTYDKGFILSLNTGICELLTYHLKPEVFMDYLGKFGFFKPVGLYGLSGKEDVGLKNFTYPSDKLSTGFGQASSVTALQMVQAYTAILNDGKMVKPYVINKIEDSYTNETLYKGKTEVVGQPIKASTAHKIVDLMHHVVNDPDGSGQRYKMDDVDIIAKTGTGQIAKGASYSASTYINSVMAAAPYDNPKVLMYYAFESPQFLTYTGDYFKQAFREALIAENITGTSTSNEDSKKQNSAWKKFEMPSLVNHSLAYTENKMKNMNVNKVMIGDGNSVIKQYPAAGSSVVTSQNIFILTDGNNITMPNMLGWSRKDVASFWDITGIPITISGYGSVSEQSVAAGSVIDKATSIEVKLK